MNNRLLKNLDSAIGEILARLLPSPPLNKLPIPPGRVLFIRPGGIGDAVLLAPVIKLLRKNFPAIHITVLAERRNGGVFPLVPEVNTVFLYDRPAELGRVFKSRFDVVIDTEQWHRLSSVVARLVTSPVKIGFNTNGRRRMFTHLVPYSHADYELESFANLLIPLGVRVDTDSLTEKSYLVIPEREDCRSTLLLEPLRGKQFVTIFPGASISERRWGGGRFNRVANALSERGYGVVVVGGTEDLTIGNEIIHDNDGINLAGATTLVETAAVIGKSSIVLSGDSGILHLAVGLGVPTVSLFGPGRAEKWAPRGAKHRIINKNIHCSPCTTFGTTPPCPHKVECMGGIAVEEVVATLDQLISASLPSISP